ncbi:MAG TPA: type II toxin-antitoxin system VapC family toxin [Candidatus Binatia bacterium]|nr:type II toxin-antitoxin system VapC family toxin [Candidatus Binatia bacterium]
MSKIVLDASAVLAIIHQESGSEKLTLELLAQATVSTVNLAEVQGKLVSSGWDPEEAWEDASSPVSEVIPFTSEQAKASGTLIAETRALGLSLGDRACLALALDLKAPVYTADRSWKNLKLGIRIHVIR